MDKMREDFERWIIQAKVEAGVFDDIKKMKKESTAKARLEGKDD